MLRGIETLISEQILYHDTPNRLLDKLLVHDTNPIQAHLCLQADMAVLSTARNREATGSLRAKLRNVDV